MFYSRFLQLIKVHPVTVGITFSLLVIVFGSYGVFAGLEGAMSRSIERLRADRLLVGPKVNLPLPRAFADEIARVTDVSQVTWTEFVFANYQPTDGNLLIIMTAPKTFFSIRNELSAAAADIARLTADPNGLLVLDTVANRWHLKVGQHITFDSGMRRKDGRSEWSFEVVGFVSAPNNPSQVGFAIGNFDAFDEARADGVGTVGRFVVRIDDPNKSSAVSKAIDAKFLDSGTPTRTEAENVSGVSGLPLIFKLRSSSARMVVLLIALAAILMISQMRRVAAKPPETAVEKITGVGNKGSATLLAAAAAVVCMTAAGIGLALAWWWYPNLQGEWPMLEGTIDLSRLPLKVFEMGLGWAAIITGVATTVAVRWPKTNAHRAIA